MKKILALVTIVFVSIPLVGADKLLPFQGYLTDASGEAINGDAKIVQFKIYDAPVSGTAVWAGEVHKLSVNQGLVNTILGTKTSFPDRYGANDSKPMFSEPLLLEITVDADDSNTITAADPPLLPRQVILPGNYAHQSGLALQADLAVLAEDTQLVEGVDLLEELVVAGGGTRMRLSPSLIDAGSIPSTAITSDDDPETGIMGNQIADGAVGWDQLATESIDISRLALAVAEALVPPGTIVAFGGTTIPEGWLLCDGSALDSQNPDYSRLMNVIGTGWGDGSQSGNGAAFPFVPGVTDFNLPDLRGEFLRGWDRGRGVDEGRAFASAQTDGIRDHVHRPTKVSGYNEASGQLGGLSRAGTGFSDVTSHSGPMKAIDSYPEATVETRPRNVSVNYIIKY